MQVGQDWGLRVERAGWGRIERLLKKMMEAEGGACGNVEDLGEDVLFGVVAVVWWDGWQMKDRVLPLQPSCPLRIHPSWSSNLSSLADCPSPAPGGPCGA